MGRLTVLMIFVLFFSIFINALPNDAGTSIDFTYESSSEDDVNYSIIETNSSLYWGDYYYEDWNLNSFIPYTGATDDVDLGIFNLTTTGDIKINNPVYYSGNLNIGGTQSIPAKILLTNNDEILGDSQTIGSIEQYSSDTSSQATGISHQILFRTSSNSVAGMYHAIDFKAARAPGNELITLLTIDAGAGAGGAVGIGTDDPAGILDVQGGTANSYVSGTPITFQAENGGQAASANNDGGDIILNTGIGKGTGVDGDILFLNNAGYSGGHLKVKRDNSKLYFGAGEDYFTEWDSSNAVINTTTGTLQVYNNSGWGTIEAGEYIDHTPTFERTDFYYRLTTDKLDEDNKVLRFEEEKVTSKFVDYSRPVNESYIVEEVNETTGEEYNVTKWRTVYPYTKEVEGRSVGETADINRLMIVDLKEKIEELENRISQLEKGEIKR